jgi:hypothetical protein
MKKKEPLPTTITQIKHFHPALSNVGIGGLFFQLTLGQMIIEQFNSLIPHHIDLRLYLL